MQENVVKLNNVAELFKKQISNIQV